MRILAIDPGTTESAWCELADGIPVHASMAPNDDMLRMVRERLVESLDVLVIENMQSMGMPVGREVFETVRWIGRYQEAWESQGGKVTLIYRTTVKLFHCGSARAKDANVRQALIDHFGGRTAIGRKAKPGPLYGFAGDMWSALAVALTAEASARSAPLFAHTSNDPIAEPVMLGDMRADRLPF